MARDDYENKFDEWKQKAAHDAQRLAGIDDLLDDEDPYSVLDDMEDAFEEGVDPETFIRETFADEIDEDADDEDEDDDSWRSDEDDDDLDDEDDEGDDLDLGKPD